MIVDLDDHLSSTYLFIALPSAHLAPLTVQGSLNGSILFCWEIWEFQAGKKEQTFQRKRNS